MAIYGISYTLWIWIPGFSPGMVTRRQDPAWSRIAALFLFLSTQPGAAARDEMLWGSHTMAKLSFIRWKALISVQNAQGVQSNHSENLRFVHQNKKVLWTGSKYTSSLLLRFYTMRLRAGIEWLHVPPVLLAWNTEPLSGKSFKTGVMTIWCA